MLDAKRSEEEGAELILNNKKKRSKKQNENKMAPSTFKESTCDATSIEKSETK